MERMDSLGVRIINTSLGYAQGFTNPKENYRPTDMTGSTSVISRATRIAAEEKGLLIVVSAGNEGDSAWEIVSTPGDSPWVLSVGATKAKSRDKIYYSSTGPAWLPYLKPDVSCFAANGTSFAAPVVTGFAACLLEKHPSLTYKRLIEIIQRSGHLYPTGNNYLGYGVPDAAKALRLAADSAWQPAPARLLPVASRSYQVKVTNPAVESVVVFHKRDERMVIRQEALAPVKGSVTINRPTGVQRSTVDLGNEVIEINWTGQ
jgi:subtilisin family serine protease